MPGPKCNVYLCSNHHGMLNDQNEKITLHRFPKKTGTQLLNILEFCVKYYIALISNEIVILLFFRTKKYMVRKESKER